MTLDEAKSIHDVLSLEAEFLLGGFCTRCGNPTVDPTESMPTTPATAECFADLLREHKDLITRLQEWVTRLQAENATLEAQVKALKAKSLKQYFGPKG